MVRTQTFVSPNYLVKSKRVKFRQLIYLIAVNNNKYYYKLTVKIQWFSKNEINIEF